MHPPLTHPPASHPSAGKMVTDHFDLPATECTSFWIRGTAASAFTAIFAVLQLDTELAHKARSLPHSHR